MAQLVQRLMIKRQGYGKNVVEGKWKINAPSAAPGLEQPSSGTASSSQRAPEQEEHHRKGKGKGAGKIHGPDPKLCSQLAASSYEYEQLWCETKHGPTRDIDVIQDIGTNHIGLLAPELRGEVGEIGAKVEKKKKENMKVMNIMEKKRRKIPDMRKGQCSAYDFLKNMFSVLALEPLETRVSAHSLISQDRKSIYT